MKLFLCSHFSSVGNQVKEEIEGKNVLFVPTASINEGYTGYVGSGRKLLKKLGANITEVEISTESVEVSKKAFKDADVIYFTGGNSFFLIDVLRKFNLDEVLKEEISKGKLYIGESAGAIICAKDISYIEKMDEIPKDYSQTDNKGLGIIEEPILPHYLTAPFSKITKNILEDFKDLNLCAINNKQAVYYENGVSKIIE